MSSRSIEEPSELYVGLVSSSLLVDLDKLEWHLKHLGVPSDPVLLILAQLVFRGLYLHKQDLIALLHQEVGPSEISPPVVLY